MTRTSRTLIALVVAVACATLVGFARVSAASDPPTATWDFAAGIACEGFALHVDVWGGPQVVREFQDKDGKPVRILQAGRGSDLLFTKVGSDPAVTFSTRPNGTVTWTTLNADGSVTQELTGHNVIVMYPTDQPAGPSTTLYVGRVILNIDAFGTFTLMSTSGAATDICAILK